MGEVFDHQHNDNHNNNNINSKDDDDDLVGPNWRIEESNYAHASSICIHALFGQTKLENPEGGPGHHL